MQSESVCQWTRKFQRSTSSSPVTARVGSQIKISSWTGSLNLTASQSALEEQRKKEWQTRDQEVIWVLLIDSHYTSLENLFYFKEKSTNSLDAFLRKERFGKHSFELRVAGLSFLQFVQSYPSPAWRLLAECRVHRSSVAIKLSACPGNSCNSSSQLD